MIRNFLDAMMFFIFVAMLVRAEKASCIDIRPISKSVAFTASEDKAIDFISVNPKDSNQVITVSRDGEMSLFDLQTQSLQWREFVGYAAFNPVFTTDARRIVFVSNGYLNVISIFNGEILQTIDLYKRDQSGRAASGNAAKIMVPSRTGDIFYIALGRDVFKVDLQTEAIVKFYAPVEANQFFGLESIRLSDNELFLYVADRSGFYAFDASSGEPGIHFRWTSMPELSPNNFGSISISRDGLYSIISSDVYIYLIENVSHTVFRRQLVASDRITTVGFSFDLSQFIVSSADGTSRVYDVATGIEKIRLNDSRPESQRVWQSVATTTSDMSLILTGDFSGTLRAWR